MNSGLRKLKKNPALLYVLAAVIGAGQVQALPEKDESYSTPPGITLVEVSKKFLKLNVLWIGLGDAEGHTLFISESDTTPGKSHCVGACAETFPPVLAVADAVDMGDWTLVARDNGRRQWAYKGKPLYRFARETRFNEVVDNLLASQQKSSLEARVPDISGVSRGLTLPEGWQVARFEPAVDMERPAAVMVKEIPAISSHALVDQQGMTLYVNEPTPVDINTGCGSDDCLFHYQPLVASELSRQLGSFTPVTHNDGSRQWSYEGALLYTYTGDQAPGDIRGQEGDGKWRAVVIARHFKPPSVTVREDLAYGNIFLTAEGMPLYSRYTIERGMSKRTEDDDTYIKGKRLGIKGCNAECLKTWRPLIAPPEARPRGFWEIYEHKDGTRQWAYKGFAQFTNIYDKPDAGVGQNNQVVYVIGDKGPYALKDVATDSIFTKGFQWRVTDLNAR